jgi:FkbM family methyltransferase
MSLYEALRPSRLTAVVDVGAAHIDTAPPYLALMHAGHCRVIGFEPQTSLWPPQTDNCATFADVIGDGGLATLHVWNAPGMTGFFPPDEAMLRVFDPTSAGGTSWGRVISKREVRTRRLDDIEQVEAIDFLKIDAQGAELAVIKGAERKLTDAVCIQAESWFLPLYDGQPLFRDVDAALSELGFVFHSFCEVNGRTMLPYRGPRGAMNQIIHGDAVYVRDFSRIERLSTESLKHMAIIAKDCYGSVDLAWRCVNELVSRGCVSAAAAKQCFFPEPEAGWWTEK